MSRRMWQVLLLTVLLAPVLGRAEETAADARRHMIRGVAAIEMAKSNADLEVAAREFLRATELDPSLAAAWYNLGALQGKIGQYDAAIQSYRRYLALMPQAEDAQKVEDEIIKLEFRQEAAGKLKAMQGTWVAADGTPYRLSMEGNRMTLATDHHFITENEVTSNYTLVGSVPLRTFEGIVYRLERTGNALSGTWWHSGIAADKCKIPEETGEVSGELREEGGTIVLRYLRNRFQAATQLSVLSDDYCREVSVIAKVQTEVLLRGPLPQGGVNVYVPWPIPDHPQYITIVRVPQGSPEAAAGLREGDEIVAIDGVPLSQLSSYDIWMKTFGEIGTDVTLTVKHDGSGQPVEIRLKRMPTPAYLPQSGSFGK